MSQDKRLGVDPLAWIGNGKDEAGSRTASSGEATTQATQVGPGVVYERIIFPGARPESEGEMGKGSKVKLEQDMETAEAIAHLEDFVESMKTRHISVESGEQTVAIPVAGSVHFEMKLSRKKDSAKCSFELEWDIDPEQELVRICGKKDKD